MCSLELLEIAICLDCQPRRRLPMVEMWAALVSVNTGASVSEQLRAKAVFAGRLCVLAARDFLKLSCIATLGNGNLESGFHTLVCTTVWHPRDRVKATERWIRSNPRCKFQRGWNWVSCRVLTTTTTILRHG